MNGTNAVNNAPLRVIEGKRAFSAKRFFLQWEWMLVLLFIGINVVNVISVGSNYGNFGSIMGALRDFMDKAILVFPMMMIILLGDIDVSVGSTIALCATVMGTLFQKGVPMGACMAIGIVVGGVCGGFNGLLISRFKELSAVIVTVSTMIIYRGIATVILRDQAAGGFPSWFTKINWGGFEIPGIGSIPFTLVFFILEAVFFVILLSKSRFGRKLYACGNNVETSRYSGINTKRIKFLVFFVMGIFAALSAIILMSKMSSARPNIAKNYELDVIAMVVLGGVATAGGKGKALGVILSTLCICFLRYGLGLNNITAETIMIIIGILLIIAVAIPNLKTTFGGKRRKANKSL